MFGGSHVTILIMDQAITDLKGVGDKLAKLLLRLKIETVGDLIHHFPRRYDDYSQLTRLEAIKPGPITAQVRVTSATGRYVRRGLHITEAVLSDDNGSVKAVWFNQPYRKNQLSKNIEYFVSGNYEFNNRAYSLLNPSLEKVSDFPKNTARIVPIYPETKGLKSHSLRKLFAQIDFSRLHIDESTPYASNMTPLQAMKLLHFPASAEDIEKGQDFFAFEELFAVVLASAYVRAENEKFKAKATPFNEDVVIKYVKSLPFVLTDDQRKVAWKCLKEMQRTSPMNRLVEGDVGSGKTVVASILGLNSITANQQVAFMVPTEVLAQQHFANLKALLAGHGVTVELYTGSLGAKAKKEVQASVRAGEVDLVVGTHALIQDGLEFKNLNLVIIDEQHRFGVKQRNVLVDKSKTLPHVLTMTATPIPRTLALTVFGDLDISIIAELPKGRKPIKTKLTSPNSMQPVYDVIKKEVAAGRQAFIIYPLIEDSETLTAKSAVEAHKKLQQKELKGLRLGLLLGRLKSEEKEAIMQDFADGKIDVLVSTTVVEVGVDVPNASVMVIEGAERFGLAQIHQLRGRVGRGEHQSYCILVPSTSQNVSKRLRALETISDGFRLAEYDLELRGPGAIYGASQHGALDLKFTKLSDPKKIAKAKEMAEDFVESGQDLLKYPRLAAQVEQYKSITHLN